MTGVKCTNCGVDSPVGARFCGACAAPLTSPCTACGHENQPGSRFCIQCAAALGDAALRPSATPIQTRSDASAGERRHATVLFSDLSGYTAMNERLDPEEVREIAGRIKTEAVRIVEGYGGIVNQFVGDEVLALFGVPTAHEDDPVRAVRTARELHAMVKGLSPKVESRIGAPLRLHTGISMGLIVTGTEDRRDGTFGITGEAVNIGARLASHAPSDTVLVSEEIQRAVADFFQLDPLPPVKLKGISGTVTPYRVTAHTGVDSRFEAAEQRGFTAYAGREAELRTLHSRLDEARAGQGQFVTVMGEPGIGKSRLLFEFRHGVPRDHATVWTGHCQPYGTVAPYHPFINLMRGALRLEEVKGADALHDHVVSALRAISPGLERYLPQYLQLLLIPSEQHAIPSELQGDSLRRVFLDAFAALFSEYAREQPLVLVLEDWHWADEASDAVLKHLTGLIPLLPLLVLVTYRPEYERAWADPQQYTPLVLQPLGEAETAAMLRSAWKAEHLPGDIVDQVHARTGGNALFTEEVARGLVEDDKVRVDKGWVTLSGDVGTLDMPDSVHAVIRARVDRLDSGCRETLRLASVLGREFSRPLLERLHPDPQRCSAALDILTGQDLIRPLRVVPEPIYLFKHALVQDEVYETLLHSQRKQLHEQAGAAIESLYPGGLEEHYEALARHFVEADNAAKAVEYLEKAGDRAAAYFSLTEARLHYRSAINILDEPRPTPTAIRHRIDLTVKWATVSHYAASDEHLRVLQSSLNDAEQLGDNGRAATVTYWLARMNYGTSDMLQAIHNSSRCIEKADHLDDEKLLALASNLLGRAYVISADYANGDHWLTKGLPLVERLGIWEEVAYSMTLLSNARVWTGRFAEGWALNEKALGIAQRIANPTREAHIQCCLGLCKMFQGLWQESQIYYSRCMEISERTGNVVSYGYGLGFSGYAAFNLGERDEGIRMALEGGRRVEETGSRLVLSIVFGWLAEAYALSGAVDEAERFAEQVIGYGRFGERMGEALAYRSLAIAAAHRSSPDWNAADAQMSESARLAREKGERPFLAGNHFHHAEILHKKRDHAAALSQLSKAEQLFSEMEMTWWSQQAAVLRGRIEGGKPFERFASYVDA